MTDFDKIEREIERAEGLERAYSTDIFGPVEGDPIKKTGEYASKENRSLITRNSAAMGRFLYERHIGPITESLRLLLDVSRAAENKINEQAEDEGLWFIAQTAPEAYLQQELRELHRVIEQALTALREHCDD